MSSSEILYPFSLFFFFFFNDTATTEIYTLSLHDALPISYDARAILNPDVIIPSPAWRPLADLKVGRSEEHTSELQSLAYLVCRLLLEKKKKTCTSAIPRLRTQMRTGRGSLIWQSSMRQT